MKKCLVQSERRLDNRPPAPAHVPSHPNYIRPSSSSPLLVFKHHFHIDLSLYYIRYESLHCCAKATRSSKCKGFDEKDNTGSETNISTENTSINTSLFFWESFVGAGKRTVDTARVYDQGCSSKTPYTCPYTGATLTHFFHGNDYSYNISVCCPRDRVWFWPRCCPH
jgi:hypothetical protein